MKSTYKIIKKLMGPLEGRLEDLLVSTWRWWTKEKYGEEYFADVVAVGRAEDKTIYAKGFCPTTVGPHVEKPSIVLRSMAQSKLVAEKGPIPAIHWEDSRVMPHQLVLLTLPSFWIRGSLKDNTQFINNWNGATESSGIPYCRYSTLR